MRSFMILLMALIGPVSMGQEENANTNSGNVMEAIYEDVWLPFMKSYEALDIEQFKSIQSQNLTRVSIDRNIIVPPKEYFENTQRFFEQFQQAGRTMDIRFSIISTAFGEDKVYQTGYYGIYSQTTASGPFKPLGYGQFTVVLEKSPTGWKIALDADKQVQIDDTTFRSAGTVYELKRG